MLTIAIPTYNRNKELVSLLTALAPQLDDSIKLIIIDNHSNIPAEESIFNTSLKNLNCIKIIRNSVNIGGAANLLKCLEVCETKWVWVLGDDDIPSPNALKIIKEKITIYEENCFINFCSTSHTRDSSFQNNNFQEFVDSINSWGQINFTSLSVFNCHKIKPHISFGYLYAYSWSPLITCMIMYMCLNEKAGSLLSNECIIDECNNSLNGTWSPIGPNLGKMVLLELPMKYNLKKEFASKLSHKPALEFSVFEILTLIENGESIKNALFLYDQLTYRLYYFENIFFLIKIKFYRLFFLFPNFSLPLVKFAVRKKMGTIITLNRDRYKRM